MLTENKISAAAYEYAGEWGIGCRIYIHAATWANEQNAAELAAKDAEIAELVDALRMVAPIMQSKNWKGGSIEKAVTAVLAKYPE